MQKNKLSELSIEDLVKKRNLLKGVSIGMGLVYMAAIAIVIYLFTSKGFKNVSYAALIPVFAFPVTFMPVLSNMSILDKEIKSRNSKI